jgi:hypothetical protein
MPRATNNIEDVQHYDLKSLPGGFVELRRMTYGEYLKRQGMAMDMQMRSEGRGKGNVMDIDLGQQKVTEFEFSKCIASHNLEDDQGNPLDFRSSGHVHMLDPRIGQEIGDLIDKLNIWEEDQAGN